MVWARYLFVSLRHSYSIFKAIVHQADLSRSYITHANESFGMRLKGVSITGFIVETFGYAKWKFKDCDILHGFSTRRVIWLRFLFHFLDSLSRHLPCATRLVARIGFIPLILQFHRVNSAKGFRGRSGQGGILAGLLCPQGRWASPSRSYIHWT